MTYYSMFRSLIAVILSCLFAYIIIYGFLSLACEFSDHSDLIKFHLQFSSIVLSILFGCVRPIDLSIK